MCKQRCLPAPEYVSSTPSSTQWLWWSPIRFIPYYWHPLPFRHATLVELFCIRRVTDEKFYAACAWLREKTADKGKEVLVQLSRTQKWVKNVMTQCAHSRWSQKAPTRERGPHLPLRLPICSVFNTMASSML